MTLQELAIRDAKLILGNAADWAQTLVFASNDSPPVTATVKGTFTKHHRSVDGEGAPYNGKFASVTVHESVLTAASYPVRNSDGEVAMKGHTVQFTDGNGTQKTYVINEHMPDEKLGIIVFNLGQFE